MKYKTGNSKGRIKSSKTKTMRVCGKCRKLDRDQFNRVVSVEGSGKGIRDKMFPRLFVPTGSTKKSANNIDARDRIPELAEAIHHLTVLNYAWP